MKKRYGKLVRDRVPEIIRAGGEVPNTRTMEQDEYRRELLYKLIEEAEEVRQAGYDPSSAAFTEELADLLEVFDAILKEFSIPIETVKTIQAQHRRTRGGFDDKVFLESVR